MDEKTKELIKKFTELSQAFGEVILLFDSIWFRMEKITMNLVLEKEKEPEKKKPERWVIVHEDTNNYHAGYFYSTKEAAEKAARVTSRTHERGYKIMKLVEGD